MIEQRTEDWFAARAGKLTASKLADALATTRSGWGASRANYMAQLVAERLTGASGEGFMNAAMQWGIDHEADAIAEYQFFRDCEVEAIGFVDHATIAMTGASPDGRIGSDGLIEVKCPNTATHIDTLLTQKIDRKYMLQMQWQMECDDRAWCDYVSFDPRMPVSMQMFVKRIERDGKLLDELRPQVVEFLDEVTAKVNALNALYTQEEAA